MSVFLFSVFISLYIFFQCTDRVFGIKKLMYVIKMAAIKEIQCHQFFLYYLIALQNIVGTAYI
jgi:hypothetical protein